MPSMLEQLRAYSEVVADTGDIDAIAQYQPLDATTNPSLLLKASALPSYAPLIEDSLAWATAQTTGINNHAAAEKTAALAAVVLAVKAGCEISKRIRGRVSTEVDARMSFDTQATIERARLLIHLYEQHGVARDRVLIKMATTWEGIEAARVLERDNIQCNLTLLFSFAQARACAEAGCFLISPFVGRVLDWHIKNTDIKSFVPAEEPGVALVKNIYQHYKQHGFNTVVMAASFRNAGEILALAGSDRLTISPALLDELSKTEGTLTRQLLAPDKQIPKPVPLDEKTFRWMMNQDAMATEKLAEGIRLFTVDQIALEKLLISHVL
ncbi:MAG TPA: transaldolase [Pseudomonadales bacterium]|nr:transaldolase [Pseudomonadales bacterium]